MPASHVGKTEQDTRLHLPLPRLVEIAFKGKAHELSLLTDPAVYEACRTRIAFTGREGGVSAPPYSSLDLGHHVGDDPSCVKENRRRVLECLGLEHACEKLVVPNQVHGVELFEANGTEKDAELAANGADGIVCTTAFVPVMLAFADCLPLVLVAPNGAFCVAHCGWRGTMAGIAAKAMRTLSETTGCHPGDINAYIGPHIGPCCYEVSESLLASFTEAFGESCNVEGKLSLEAAVRASLGSAGAAQERIASVGVCTSCSADRFYSYRFEGGLCGRHGAFACWEGE